MKIAHINTADNSGGAARAAFRLHRALNAAGHTSRMVVGWKVEPTPDTASVLAGGRLPKRILRRAALILDRRLSLQYALLPWGGDILTHPFVRDADVIHLHNLHGAFFPYRVLPRLGRIAPLVWSLHDMWAMTGHCGYSYECERWKTGCGRCPHRDEYPPVGLDTTALHWRLKDRTYRQAQMTIVTGSTWMASLVRQSPLLNRFPVQTIPYGTDLSVFRPLDKAQARRILGLPSEARVILFFAGPEPRKGTAYFLQALPRLQMTPPPWLLVAGGRLSGAVSGFPIKELGHLNSDELLNLCYGAADVFVLPTVADNLPLSVLDALAAGTPAVVFDAGGLPDVVKHLETGYLVPSRDPVKLAEAIDLLLTDAALRDRLGQAARRMAEREFSIETYMQRYLSLYETARRQHDQALSTAEGTPATVATAR